MFDIGGWEFLIIIVVAIVIVGPKDLPGVVKTVTEGIRKIRGLAREFQNGMEELAREVELDKIGKDVKEGIGFDDPAGSIRNEIENTIDPTGEIGDAFRENRSLLDDELQEDDYYFDEDDDDELDAEAERLRLVDEKKRKEDQAAASGTDTSGTDASGKGASGSDEGTGGETDAEEAPAATEEHRAAGGPRSGRDG